MPNVFSGAGGVLLRQKIAQRHGPHGNTETGAHQGNNLTHNENEEEFIVSWARELPTDQPLKIIVHMPDTQASRPEAKELGAAITRYFNYRAHIVTLDLKELFRVGRRALAIGATVLSFSVLAGRAVANIAPGPVAQVVEESLLIFGWVANWRPIEIFRTSGGQSFVGAICTVDSRPLRSI